MTQKLKIRNGAVPDAEQQIVDNKTHEAIVEAIGEFDTCVAHSEETSELVSVLLEARQYALALEVLKIDQLHEIRLDLNTIAVEGLKTCEQTD